MAQTVEELAEILDNIKNEADKNAESCDKLLKAINNKLDFISNDKETDDLIKVYLTELKKTLEERHSLVVSEFGKIENSFNALKDEQSTLTKTSETKEMFDIFSSHMQSVARELFNQKELFAQYNERFEKFASDKTDKNDIVNSVSAIRKDIEIINQGFEATVSDINSNIQSIFKNLIVMDPSAQNDIVRRELENIYIATNSILTALHAVEQKNDDLIHNLENYIVNDSSELLHEKLDLITERTDTLSTKFEPLARKTDLEPIENKTEEISEKINSLPLREDLKYFAEKTNELSAQIGELPGKEDINAVSDKTIEGLQEKFEAISVKSEIEEIIKKTDEISSKFEPLSLKSDFDNLVYQTNQISEKLDSALKIEDLETLSGKASAIKEKLDTLPQQGDLADMYKAVHEFSSILNTLRTNLLSSNEETSMMIREQLDKLNSVLSAVVTENDFTGFRHDLADFIQKIIDNSESLNQNLSTNKDTLRNLITEIESLDVHKNIATVATALEGLRITSTNNVARIVGEINTISTKLDVMPVSSVEEKLDSVSENITDAVESIKILQNEVMEKLSEDDNSEKFQSLNNNIEFLKETVMSSQASNETALAEKLLALRDIITNNITIHDEKFLDLKEKLDEIITKSEKISADTEIKIGNSLSEITDLKTEIENVSKVFTEWNYNQENRDSKVVGMISSELGEIGTSITTLQDSIQAGVHHELAKNTEIVEKQINNLIEFIETLKSDLQNNDEEPAYDFDKTFKEIKNKITAVKQEINLVNTDIIDVLNAKSQAIMLELAPLKTYLEQFSEISQKLEAHFDETEKPKTFQNTVEELKELISKAQKENQPDLEKHIIETAEDIKTSLSDKITSGNEDLRTLISVAMNNDDITWAIDNLKDDLSDKVTRIFNERNNYGELLEKSNEISNEVSGGNTKITELLDVLNRKVDILAMSDNEDEFEVLDEINEVKNMISSQRNLLENSASAEKANAIETRLEELITKIDSIDSIEPAELKEVRESILTAILNVFEQISFIEESEDIKDFVEEKTDEINRNLTEVKQQLKQIVNVDDEYSYTLQDVESDIAKLRLVINELSTTSSKEELSDISDNIHRIVTSVEDLQTSLTQEQISDLKLNFEKLSEDILSISSRTNKLLLTSDESYNALNNGLNDFSNVIYKLEERINYLDNKEITERIEQKLDNTLNVVTESTNSDKVMRQALMYMGEWIDTTSENIESICEQSDKINDIRYFIETIQDKITEQTQLINSVAERFEEQQERMDRLEQKLEKILFAIDDIDDTKLTKKVDKIDRQLAKFSTTIEKLASYVDE